jgi:hypothetical protein
MTIEEHLELLRARLDAVEQWEADMRRIHHTTWHHEHWWMSGQLGATLIAAQRAASEMSFWARKVAEVSRGKTQEGDKA